MTTSYGFRKEQKIVALAMISALLVTVIVLGLILIADGTRESTSFISRFKFALHASAVVMLWLMAAIANVARIRFFSEQDISNSSAGGGSEKVRIGNAILQNTFEQVSLAIFTYSIVAATFERSNSILVALACLFSIGRLLFWIGFKYGAKGRALGFALTFYPSALALLMSVATTLFG